MLASTVHEPRRRGIVLVLVLAMLGLLALIGITFATFTGQAKINARNYAQSIIQPQDDELMDFALTQLINDTSDPRSAIRGHSLARDMYGNDANGNGYLPTSPTTGQPFTFSAVTDTNYTDYVLNSDGSTTSSPGTSSVNGNYAQLAVVTNISTSDPNFYGFNFTGWIMRVSYVVTSNNPLPNGVAKIVDQTLEITSDSASGNTRQFTVQVGPYIPDPNATAPALVPPALYNATNGTITMGAMDAFLYSNASTTVHPWIHEVTSTDTINQIPPAFYTDLVNNFISNAGNYIFSLDGRYLRAFNGPGQGSKALYGNFRYNGSVASGLISPGSPNSPGMDEDYDACDLENWFLALQSADGSMVIPSFHRPGIIRYDNGYTLANGNTIPAVNDWQRINYDGYTNNPGVFNPASSFSRILRPVAFDGHDANTFPDLTPDPNTGKITYDVDNDGDGVTDSVWLDLGYPARKNAQGQLYKPLFAFMVIGLNGRIPLNTAGNLAGNNPSGSANGGPAHAAHLGSSVSEIDPTYALQNANQGPGTDVDPFNSGASATPANSIYANFPSVNNTADAQVDVNGNDVRLTQLRNILAGTRPQPNPTSITNITDNNGNTINGDRNALFGIFGSSGTPQAYYLPNGTGQLTGTYPDIAYGTTGEVAQATPPVAGRWGEAQSMPGFPIVNPAGGFYNLLGTSYNNQIRAGYSYDISDILSSATGPNGAAGLPRDAADDNFNMFDPYPPGHTGELSDSELYDTAGALVLAVDRMRRYVSPADINGTGHIRTWSASTAAAGGSSTPTGSNLGADAFGRVLFASYFRPPGAPGLISTAYSGPPTTAGALPPPIGATYGSVVYPGIANFYDSAPYPAFVPGSTTVNGPFTGQTPFTLANETYLPDVTNNPLHGFEAAKFPNLYSSGSYVGASQGALRGTRAGGAGMPVDVGTGSPPNIIPSSYPTYDITVNAQNDGLNEADEMNLYNPNPLLDSPFGPSDLEWLYRQQDVDGASLTSRLSQLAPVSFTNQIDGTRRVRLFSTDSWEMNNFVFANDNPTTATAGLSFTNNHRFGSGGDGNFTGQLPVINPMTPAPYLSTPSLAHRDKKINLNYPLPVSNDPFEPVRQKWISDTYYMLKAALPPRAVDTAEELAGLSQFVINIIDFRDPDCTITIWTNPDVNLVAGALTSAGGPPSAATPTLNQSATAPSVTLNTAQTGNLQQFGMEYNPIAINETLGYSFMNSAGTSYNRVYVELVNTLTQTAFNAPPTSGTASSISSNDASMLDLGGMNSPVAPAGPPIDPYAGGCWDLVFTVDDPASRPDPIRGDLIAPTGPGGTALTMINWFGLTPLSKQTLTTGYTGAGTASDAILTPLAAQSTSAPTASTATPAPFNYFYVVGNTIPSSVSPGPEQTTPFVWQTTPLTTYGVSTQQGQGTAGGPTMTSTVGFGTPVTQSTATATTPANDPFYIPTSPTSPKLGTNIKWYPGILPGITSSSTSTYAPSVPGQIVRGQTAYFWVCLRRPANLFAPVSAVNPMVVVDSMRFPFIEGTGTATTDANNNPTTKAPYNTIYSAQRMQPFRGGHAVPASVTTTGTPLTAPALDSRYGFTEQTAVPANPGFGVANAATAVGLYYQQTTPTTVNNPATGQKPPTNTTTPPASQLSYFYHTLGSPNDTAEKWDYFPFNDRDFTSVAELMLVPGCPPGLFTKQFVEFSPSQLDPTGTAAGSNIFTLVKPLIVPPGAAVATTTMTPTPPGGLATPVVTDILTASSTSTAPDTVPPVGAYQTFQFTGSTTLNYGQSSPPLAYGTPAWSTAGGQTTAHTYPYLVDKFYYTAPSLSSDTPASLTGTTAPKTAAQLVDTASSDGWYRMFEFFEVPSQSMGAFGTVAQGTNFDWARQDVKPGLMNLNLIIDEEPFFAILGKQNASFTQALLNMPQIPQTATVGSVPTLPLTGNFAQTTVGSTPLPMVVTAVDANGSPSYVFPISNAGITNSDTLTSTVDSRIKAAFAQFLWLRHGGSGYIFGYGTGAVGQNAAVPFTATSTPGTGIPAERPFRALSYPDIDYTVMRPANLPPSSSTTPALASGTPTITGASSTYVADPGQRNIYLYPGYTSGTVQTAGTNLGAGMATVAATGVTTPTLPPPIPARRLFQVPDAAQLTTGVNTTPSNASEAGDPFINNLQSTTGPILGALPPYTPVTGSPIGTVNDNYPTITQVQPTSGGSAISGTTTLTVGGSSGDARMHPNWHIEMMQRVMNLTTVRTHQYAVWITVGFFEIRKQGDPSMLNAAYQINTPSVGPQLAFDIMGPEIGAAGGKAVRFRGFFLVDRTKLTGFNPTNTGSFRAAVTYRKVIQ